MTAALLTLLRSCSCLALMVVMLAVPGRAEAAVALRAASCNTNTTFLLPPWTISINKPTGTVSGDVMVATVRSTLATPGAPTGWTQLFNSGYSTTWYKVAGASEPASYAFSMFIAFDSAAGAIASFSGVDTTSIFAGTSAQTTTGTAAAVALPDVTAGRAGSMRYSTVTSGANVTSSFSAGLTEACDVQVGSLAAASGYEPTGVGTTAARTDTRSGTGSNVAQTFVLQPPVSGPTCNAGGANITAPAAISFPPTTLNGLDQNITTTTNLTVDDQRGSGAGWSLQATSTTFASGGNALPTTAATVTGITPSDGTGNCSSTANGIGFPVTVPAAAVAPTATKIFNTPVGTGEGPTDMLVNLRLHVPASTRIGTYTSAWTLTLASGP